MGVRLTPYRVASVVSIRASPALNSPLMIASRSWSYTALDNSSPLRLTGVRRLLRRSGSHHDDDVNYSVQLYSFACASRGKRRVSGRVGIGPRVRDAKRIDVGSGRQVATFDGVGGMGSQVVGGPSVTA